MKSSSLIVSVVLLGSSVLLAGCAPLDSLKSSLVEKVPALAMIPGFADKDSKMGQIAEAGKLSMMVATGKSGKCTITDKKSSTVMEYYIKGKKMKFASEGMGMGMTEPGTPTNDPMPTAADAVKKISYYLNDTEYTYMWEQGAKTGIKTKIEAPAKEDKTIDTEEDDSKMAEEKPDIEIEKFEEDTNYTISCDMKELKDSEFIPPADVKFMDYSQMNEQNYMMYMQDAQTTPGSKPTTKKMPASPEMDAETARMMEQYKDQMDTAPADE